MIDTPITADDQGNIYFGFVVTGSNPLNLKSGVARMDSKGKGTCISRATRQTTKKSRKSRRTVIELT